MVFKLEKQFFYWRKDYAYFGSPWTQPKVVNSLRSFYVFIGLGILLLFVFAVGHFFNFWVFHEKTSFILLLFSLIKFVSLAYLFLFLYRIFVGHDFSKTFESNLQAEVKTKLEAIHKPIEEKKTEKNTDKNLQTELFEGPHTNTSDTSKAKLKKSEIIDKISLRNKVSSYSHIKHIPKAGKSLFPSSRKKNKFIIETSLEQTYSKNSVKVNHTFRPATNRNSDKIVFEVKSFYQDKLQNSVCLITNTGRKGKLFFFNELHQNKSFVAATDLALQNLFYSHLPEKKVEVFMEEWHKGFKPFSSKDVCQSLAMHFHPENHQLSCYNAGINHAYFYDSKYDIFSLFDMHQSKLTKVSKKKITTTQLQLQPDNLILIFSKEILEIKNRSGEKINIEMLFEVIRKNSKKPLDKMIKTLEIEIKNVALLFGRKSANYIYGKNSYLNRINY